MYWKGSIRELVHLLSFVSTNNKEINISLQRFSVNQKRSLNFCE